MQNNRFNKPKFFLLVIVLMCIHYKGKSNHKSLRNKTKKSSLKNINLNKILNSSKANNLKDIYIISDHYYNLIEDKSSQIILNILKDYAYSLKENIPISSITYNYLRKFNFCYKQHCKSSNTINKINMLAINRIALVNLYLIYKTLTKGDIYSSYKYLTMRD